MGQSLYETDEHRWMLAQIDILRGGDIASLDRENLAAYFTDMTIRDRRELLNRFVVLLQHLLKFHARPGASSRSWLVTVLGQQQNISDILTGTPSMRTYAPGLFQDAWFRAVKLAMGETGLPRAAFPGDCPWPTESCLTFVPPEPAR